MRRVITILALSALIVVFGASAAFANFGPHGAYAEDTDACAGCHRAHTSFSSLTWTTSANTTSSALLVSSATTIEEFCLACHGDEAPGASTNVEAGIFDAGPSAGVGSPAGTYLYNTSSTFNAALNGGAFSTAYGATSMHDMEQGEVTDPMWGAGSTAPDGTNLTCTMCHDVHGSSNYRILKDRIGLHTVGGYTASDTPQPIVYSSEPGYPIPNAGDEGGWLKHQAGQDQMATYLPNYTTAEYFFAEGASYSTGEGNRSMSTWCSACHERYNEGTSAYDYGTYETDAIFTRAGSGELTSTGGTAAVGNRVRHRHPVDTTPATANTINGFGQNAKIDSDLPLAKSRFTYGSDPGDWVLTDYMDCLTCHRAHGSSVEMTGWANASLVTSTAVTTTWTVAPKVGDPAGVAPNFSSSLLRVDNRGVCEQCHNK